MTHGLQVFLLMGQSNMSGRGRLDEVPQLTHPDVYVFRGGQWIPAKDPLHADKPKMVGVGLGMSFAVDLVEATGNPVGLVPCAVGGSPLSRWMPGNDLYEIAIESAKAACRDGRLCGILWHQGEHDSCKDDESCTYGDRFQTMLRTLRDDLNAPNVPVVVGELGPFLAKYDGCVHYERVNGHLRELQSVIPKYACANSEGLGDNGDDLHFNAMSLREFGHRYFERFSALAGLSD